MRRIASIASLVLAAMVSVPVGAALPAGIGPVKAKVIWVDFWASWCAPCRRSFPWLNEMQSKYGEEGLEIVAVNVDKDRKLADEFLDQTPADFMVRFDPKGKLASKFDVQAMPSSFLLDASGKVLGRHLGFKLTDRDTYEEQIRKALADTGARP